MVAANFAQVEADALIAMEKRRGEDTERNYPDLGGFITIPLVSIDRRESFLLDLRQGRIDLSQGRLPEPGTANRSPRPARLRLYPVSEFQGRGDRITPPAPFP